MVDELGAWAERTLERAADSTTRCKTSLAGGHGRDENLVQELRDILARFRDDEHSNMRVTAFNILRYDPDGQGGLAYHIDMDFYPLQRWRRILTLRGGTRAEPGELEDLTSWRSLESARNGEHGYMQPDIEGLDPTHVELTVDTLSQGCFTHGRCPREPSTFDVPLRSTRGSGCLTVCTATRKVAARTFRMPLAFPLATHFSGSWFFLACIVNSFTNSTKWTRSHSRPHGKYTTPTC